MKRILIIALCCLLLTACSQPAPDPTTAPSSAPVDTAPSETDASTEAPTEAQTEAPTEAPTEPEPVTVTIYYGNENADGFETNEVPVAEVNMNVLVEQLIAHNVLPEDVYIGSMQIDGTCLRLNFSPSFGDHVCSMGTSGERMVIGSVVNTFLTAYPDAQTVFIEVSGEILESGHVVYDFPLEYME